MLANLKVGPRLALGFGVVLVLMLVLNAVALSRMSFIRAQLEQVVAVDSLKLQLVNAMRDQVRYQAVAIRDVVLQDDLAFKKSELKRMREATKAYRDEAAQLEPLLSDPQEKAALAKAVAAEVKAKGLLDETIDLSMSESDKEAGESIRTKLRPAQAELTGALEELLAQVEARSKVVAADAARAYEGARMLIVGIGVLAIVAGVVVGYFIQRSIARPLRRALEVAERIAEGDLTQRIEASSRDEVGQLLVALNAMNASLANIVRDVRSGTDGIRTGAKEIALGNGDLSQRTEQQASSLEETAASMEQLTATVKQNAANSRQGNALAAGASEVAERGGSVVREVVETMQGITASSKKIADIVGVIDGIAFQTNILALNAAVEAARAGAQGRGFAVVAGEVRNLAQRSAAAAKEIKELIEGSVARVDAGAELVDQAGRTMEEIVDAVRRVATIIGEITVASNEQSSGIEQVNGAIALMDKATQQNAALVEQAAAAAMSLEAQAQHLTRSVSIFKLDAMAAPEATEQPSVVS